MLGFLKNKKWPRLGGFRRDQGFVALDIGSSSVKMVEAAVDANSRRLVNLGMFPLPPAAVQNNMVADKEAVVKAIRGLLQAGNVKATQAICSVPGRAVIIKKIQLPAQSEQALEANIEFEAQNAIPESLENVNLDYQIVDYLEDGNNMEVLLVAVKKDIVNSYVEVLAAAGLTPAVMDVDYFAMENMYEASYEPQPDKAVGLIHVGASYTSINILRNGASTFTGDLPVGGREFTECLMDGLKLSYEEAETLKITGRADGKKSSDLPALFKPACASLAEDIGRTLSLYGTMDAEEGIHTIYLSGGSAKVAGLAPLLEDKLGVPTLLAEPFRGFNVPKSIDQDFLAESSLAFTVAAGLSIRRPGDK